jgi:CheY-like chemotaxis protein
MASEIACTSLAGARRMGNAIPRRPVVLVVEDEFFLRTNAVLMIEDAGFDVLEAANADQAIEILEDRPDVHVIFTDIQIPGSMDGLKLAHAVRGRWPPIKIIATSGHVDLRTDDLPEGGRFLPKPSVRRKSSGPFVSWSETSRPANCLLISVDASRRQPRSDRRRI